ncbi:TfuA-like protein [Diaphorobacter sp. LR2014-1]|uniref:TfuA-like protein n=1 Tax=Diaphorobacter sp. LR2014-1 TaxID=1933219 RepID=UPI000CDB749E|nr:TfuA-like protein [Diaphorobacter sp. LR2014-1]POR11495.1 hypothetical protein BV908_06885 [Diaphorobacter sp. LR2014-1]
MKPIVFLGLSLAAVEAKQILDADYRGPVVQGDLDAITSPALVVIIDGILDCDQRLPRAEVARALDRGLVIHGVSSLGAVLAVELEHKGLKGSGRIYEVLRDLDADLPNLIAALYTADQLRPLTTPLINAVVYCREQGMGTGNLDAVVHELASIPLDARNWEGIEDATARAGVKLPATVRLMDVKREDAINLLQALNKYPFIGK